MDFREATDALCERIEHTELAGNLRVSVASVRQARLDATARAHRAPPHGWESVILRLAEQRIRHYQELVEHIRQRQEQGTHD
jgi:hypothetical protein